MSFLAVVCHNYLDMVPLFFPSLVARLDHTREITGDSSPFSVIGNRINNEEGVRWDRARVRPKRGDISGFGGDGTGCWEGEEFCYSRRVSAEPCAGGIVTRRGLPSHPHAPRQQIPGKVDSRQMVTSTALGGNPEVRESAGETIKSILSL